MARRRRPDVGFGKIFETDAGLFVIQYMNGKKNHLYKIKLSHIRKY